MCRNLDASLSEATASWLWKHLMEIYRFTSDSISSSVRVRYTPPKSVSPYLHLGSQPCLPSPIRSNRAWRSFAIGSSSTVNYISAEGFSLNLTVNSPPLSTFDVSFFPRERRHLVPQNGEIALRLHEWDSLVVHLNDVNKLIDAKPCFESHPDLSSAFHCEECNPFQSFWL